MNEQQTKEWEELQAMVDTFAGEMKARLYQKLLEGKSGFNNKSAVQAIARNAADDASGAFANMLYCNTDKAKRKAVDSANRLAMVYSLLSQD